MTGVQTCALPISEPGQTPRRADERLVRDVFGGVRVTADEGSEGDRPRDVALVEFPQPPRRERPGHDEPLGPSHKIKMRQRVGSLRPNHGQLPAGTATARKCTPYTYIVIAVVVGFFVAVWSICSDPTEWC